MRATLTISTMLAFICAAAPQMVNGMDAVSNISKSGANEIFKLTRERKFPSPAKQTLLGPDANGILIPRIVVVEGGAQFFDAESKLLKDLKAPTGAAMELIASQNRPLVGALITRGHHPEKGGWTDGEYLIFDESGKETLHLSDFKEQMIPWPSPSGTYAVGWNGGPPLLIDKDGPRPRPETGETWSGSHTVTDVVFSPDGQFFAARASHGITSITVLFDQTGKILWSYEKDGAIVFAPLNKWVAIVDENGSHVIDTRTGKRRDLSPTGDVNSKLRVSDDSKTLLIVRGNGSAARINMDSGKSLWEKELVSKSTDGSRQIILEAAATPDLAAFAALTLSTKMIRVRASDGSNNRMPSYTDSSILIFDKQGVLVDKIAIPPSEVSAGKATIQLSSDGKTVYFSGQSGSYAYSRQ